LTGLQIKLIALAAALALVACQMPAAIPCELDADCPAGGVCDEDGYYCVPAGDAEDAGGGDADGG